VAQGSTNATELVPSDDDTTIAVSESNAVPTIRWYELAFIVSSAIGVTSIAVYGIFAALSAGAGY
jgi:hypothetical protein